LEKDVSTQLTLDALEALPFHIVALIPGAETGVELADRLSEKLGLRSNGEKGSEARRNKYVMGEKVMVLYNSIRCNHRNMSGIKVNVIC